MYVRLVIVILWALMVSDGGLAPVVMSNVSIYMCTMA